MTAKPFAYIAAEYDEDLDKDHIHRITVFLDWDTGEFQDYKASGAPQELIDRAIVQAKKVWGSCINGKSEQGQRQAR